MFPMRKLILSLHLRFDLSLVSTVSSMCLLVTITQPELFRANSLHYNVTLIIQACGSYNRILIKIRVAKATLILFRYLYALIYPLWSPAMLISIHKEQGFSTSVPWEFLKHATPDYLVRALTSFPWDCQIKKNDNSQYNNSWPMWINIRIILFVRSAQIECIFWCAAEFWRLVYVHHEMKMLKTAVEH